MNRRDFSSWWALALVLMAMGCGNGGGHGSCPTHLKGCGPGCIPLNAVCCNVATGDGYCPNSLGTCTKKSGCFSSNGSDSNYCCSNNGTFGSNDCPTGQVACGPTCVSSLSFCRDARGGDAGAQHDAGMHVGGGDGDGDGNGTARDAGMQPEDAKVVIASYCTLQSHSQDQQEEVWIFQIHTSGTVTGAVGDELTLLTNPTWTSQNPETLSCQGWTDKGQYSLCKRGPSDPAMATFMGLWPDHAVTDYVGGAPQPGDVAVSGMVQRNGHAIVVENSNASCLKQAP